MDGCRGFLGSRTCILLDIFICSYLVNLGALFKQRPAFVHDIPRLQIWLTGIHLQKGYIGFCLEPNERLGKEWFTKGAGGISFGASLTWFLFSDLPLKLGHVSQLSFSLFVKQNDIYLIGLYLRIKAMQMTLGSDQCRLWAVASCESDLWGSGLRKNILFLCEKSSPCIYFLHWFESPPFKQMPSILFRWSGYSVFNI